MSLRVLVCGSRTFKDAAIVEAILDGLYQHHTMGHLTVEMSSFVVIEGGQVSREGDERWGVDYFAAQWAEHAPTHSHNESPDDPHFEHLQFPADWSRHGKAAGPIRNQQMLDEGKPDIVVAITDKPLEESRGTADMVRRAQAAGIRTYHLQLRLKLSP